MVETDSDNRKSLCAVRPAILGLVGALQGDPYCMIWVIFVALSTAGLSQLVAEGSLYLKGSIET